MLDPPFSQRNPPTELENLDKMWSLKTPRQPRFEGSEIWKELCFRVNWPCAGIPLEILDS